MDPNERRKRIEEDKRLLEEIDTRGEGLTEWEQEFLETCLRETDAGGILTDARRAKAEQIRDERC